MPPGAAASHGARSREHMLRARYPVMRWHLGTCPCSPYLPPMADAELHNWLHHWQDEGDAAFLYGVLAAQEPDAKKREIYEKLAGVEERHTHMWAKLLGDHGHPVPAGGPAPTLNARVMAWFGRRFGPRYLLPLLLREEGREVKGYMDLHRASPAGDAKEGALTLAKESAAAAQTRAGGGGGA